jgi:hypothetical protein
MKVIRIPGLTLTWSRSMTGTMETWRHEGNPNSGTFMANPKGIVSLSPALDRRGKGGGPTLGEHRGTAINPESGSIRHLAQGGSRPAAEVQAWTGDGCWS